MTKHNIHLIHKKHHNMINSVDLDDEGVGVWLERSFHLSLLRMTKTRLNLL